MLQLNLADITSQRDRIVLDADGRDLPIAAYRERVEAAIRELLRDNPVLRRIQAGDFVTDDDLRALGNLLERQEPEIDVERLRRVYDARRASFLQLKRHVLGVETLERWPTTVTREFETLIGSSNWSALQIRFLQTLKTFMIQRPRVERADLVNAPFTQIHPAGIRGIFQPHEIERIVEFAGRLAA
jgi:type I restriction enzyme R subunit